MNLDENDILVLDKQKHRHFKGTRNEFIKKFRRFEVLVETTAGETFSSSGASNRLDAKKHFCSSSSKNYSPLQERELKSFWKLDQLVVHQRLEKLVEVLRSSKPPFPRTVSSGSRAVFIEFDGTGHTDPYTVYPYSWKFF